MKLFFFQNTFDNIVTQEASTDADFDYLVTLFCAPHIKSDTKEDVMLFCASSFKLTFDEGARPADRAVDARLENSPRVLVHGPKGEFRAARRETNIITVDALVLDYDGGASLETTINLLSDLGLQHVGYTSHSHLRDGKTDKFRVIVPLNKPCPKNEWAIRRHHFKDLFPEVDNSSYSFARSFYMPSAPSETYKHAFSWSLDGEPFNWELLEPRELAPEPEPINRDKLYNSGSGPIIWKTFDMVAFMKDKGLYTRSVGENKHDVVCPNYQSHTGATKAGTVVWQDGHDWPSFYCSHNACKNFDFFEHFKKTLGKGWMAPYCLREAPKLSPKTTKLLNKLRGYHG